MPLEPSRSDADPQEWLENCFNLPAYNPKVERVHREISQLFAQPEIQQRLLEKGRILKPITTAQPPDSPTAKAKSEADSHPPANQIMETGLRELARAIQVLFRLDLK